MFFSVNDRNEGIAPVSTHPPNGGHQFLLRKSYLSTTDVTDSKSIKKKQKKRRQIVKLEPSDQLLSQGSQARREFC